jgi:hypothetical protein
MESVALAPGAIGSVSCVRSVVAAVQFLAAQVEFESKT